MSLSTNTTYRLFVEKLGGTDPATFVGDAGEVFLNPSIPTLKLSDGSTPGGIGIGTTGGISSGNPFDQDLNTTDAVGFTTITSDSFQFDTSAGISVGPGQMAWNSSDGTLDIGLSYSDVVLQVGQEIHYCVRNNTGVGITNGTAVYCSGVTVGSGRIEVSPFVANNTIDSTFFLGLATQNISNGVNGIVAHFGYVRGLDTRGTAATAISVGDEDWIVGDKLYAHPTAAGKLTKVEPTLPNQKICVASVINRHQSVGVLFVRPTQVIPLDVSELTDSISLLTLKSIVAVSTDFASFKAGISTL
jgi:hypothetical protein